MTEVSARFSAEASNQSEYRIKRDSVLMYQPKYIWIGSAFAFDNHVIDWLTSTRRQPHRSSNSRIRRTTDRESSCDSVRQAALAAIYCRHPEMSFVFIREVAPPTRRHHYVLYGTFRSNVRKPFGPSAVLPLTSLAPRPFNSSDDFAYQQERQLRRERVCCGASVMSRESARRGEARLC